MAKRVGALTVAVLVATAALGGAAGAHAGHLPRASKVAIYAAAIRQLVTVNSSFGPDPRFGRIFVLDRPNAAAVRPIGGGKSDPVPSPRFSKAVRAALRKELRDLPPVVFVGDRDDVIADAPSRSVVDDGALVTVGPIVGEGSQVQVGVSLYVTNLAATWLTYVLEGGGRQWKVLGTTGPIAVA